MGKRRLLLSLTTRIRSQGPTGWKERNGSCGYPLGSTFSCVHKIMNECRKEKPYGGAYILEIWRSRSNEWTGTLNVAPGGQLTLKPGILPDNPKILILIPMRLNFFECILLYVCACLDYMYVCTPYVCLVPVAFRRGHWEPNLGPL